MTDETSTETNSAESSPTDERFEVKWRKRGGEQPAVDRVAETDTPVADVSADVETLQRQLREEQERARNLQERWHRATADLANLKRRSEQERSDMEQFATMVLVAELLPVLDNFERAIATIPGNLEMLTWIHGVLLIERHLRALLERQGLVPIETEDQTFDPNYHEAVSERSTSEVAPGTILQEYQKGYMMYGRVLRPSLVEVSAGVANESVPQPQSEATSETQAERIAEDAETENSGP